MGNCHHAVSYTHLDVYKRQDTTAQNFAPEAEEKSPAPAKDRRKQRGDASAQRIIDATIDLIAEDGISSVTMQRIAAKVGSSNALVVFPFGSKDNLFAAVLRHLTCLLYTSRCV